MKVAARVLDYESTVEGDKVGMTIDESALAHIMSVLTDLYSDPEMAVLREYSTNAFDAHVEAGITRPIEVQLPTALSPFLRIRDYGEGLDADDIRDIYSRYGTSTKRESNDVVGMLGLGCKSALTYTDQFTLVGIKDGFSTTVSVSRDEDGAGSMTIVEACETDAESGVEIIIPAKRGNAFEAKAAAFFRYWTAGTVVVNGEPPRSIDGFWIADDLCLSSEVDQPMVVMGNVAYPVPVEEYSGGNHHLVAFVDIGEVHFTPSRESLQMTSQTKATLAHLRERQATETKIAAEKEIADAPTRWDAIKAAIKVNNALGLMGSVYSRNGYRSAFGRSALTVQYKGADIPHLFELPMVLVNGEPPYRTKGWSEEKSISAAWEVEWIVGYDSNAFTPYKRMKLEQWAEKNNVERKGMYFAFVHEIPAEIKMWIDPKRIHPWADIKAEKIVRDSSSERRDGRPTGSYGCYVAGTWHKGLPADEIDTKAPLFWVHGSSNYYGGDRDRSIQWVMSEHPDATIVYLGQNRIEKFKRDFPNAKEVHAYVKDVASKWLDKQSAENRLAYTAQQNGSLLKLLAKCSNKIEDPAIVEGIRLATKDVSKMVNDYSVFCRITQIYLTVEDWNDPLDQYPLTSAINSYNLSGKVMDEFITYLNAAYAARKEV